MKREELGYAAREVEWRFVLPAVVILLALIVALFGCATQLPRVASPRDAVAVAYAGIAAAARTAEQLVVSGTITKEQGKDIHAALTQVQAMTQVAEQAALSDRPQDALVILRAVNAALTQVEATLRGYSRGGNGGKSARGDAGAAGADAAGRGAPAGSRGGRGPGAVGAGLARAA